MRMCQASPLVHTRSWIFPAGVQLQCTGHRQHGGDGEVRDTGAEGEKKMDGLLLCQRVHTIT